VLLLQEHLRLQILVEQFKILLKSELHRSGSCGLVTRSGGLFNELSNIISLNADGIAEGVAIGGDRFVGSTFIDNLLRMEKNPDVKYMVLLGEVGGIEEYKVIEAVKSGEITKPIIAWCIGTIAKYYDSGVQFGHAGASANSDMETAEAKNRAMQRQKLGGLICARKGLGKFSIWFPNGLGLFIGFLTPRPNQF